MHYHHLGALKGIRSGHSPSNAAVSAGDEHNLLSAFPALVGFFAVIGMRVHR